MNNLCLFLLFVIAALSEQQPPVNPSNPNLPAMYKPTVTVNSPNFTAVLRQNERAIGAYKDEACDLPDPYWCQSYVKQFIDSQTRFNHVTLQGACSQLKITLLYADNRCCQAARSQGC